MAAAAALLQFNNYLNNVIGVDDDDIRLALNEQGIVSFDAFIPLVEDDISRICSTLRRPGGMIPNPNVGPNQPNEIPNPGYTIGHGAELRLKMLRYYVHHMARIQPVPTVAHGTLNVITQLYLMRDQDKNETEPELPDKLTKLNGHGARVALENLDDYLLVKRGSSGSPLAYVVRENAALPAVDPGYGLPSHVEELIARGPHTGHHYAFDNIQVWTVIRHITHGGPAWDWVSDFARTRNGRAAYIAFKTHYLGPAFQSRIQAEADGGLEDAWYDGRSRTFTFESYCSKLQGCFTDLAATGERVDESRKVRIFLNKIKDPRLATAVSQCWATPDLHATFENAVNFILQFVDRARVANTRQVGSVQGGRGAGRGGRSGRGNDSGRGGRSGRGRGGQGRGGRGNGGGKRGNITDRYYDATEWAALSAEQQSQVRVLRAERDQRRGVMAVDRNVRPRSDVSEVTAPTVVTAPTQQQPPEAQNVGAIMSRRQSNGNNSKSA